jgi:hypothetical protein
LVLVLGIGIPIACMAAVDNFAKAIPANRSANAFFIALRSHRVDDARAHATPEFRTRLASVAAEAPPWSDGSELARALSRVSSSRTHDGSFGGDWSEGCVNAKVDGTTPLWLVMRKLDGTWLVQDVRIDAQPRECRFEADGD